VVAHFEEEISVVTNLVKDPNALADASVPDV
jgi:hypothetical protein